MRLRRSHAPPIDDPTDRQIDAVPEDLEDDNDSFAILSDGDDFIQTAGKLPDQLMVEYQEDDTQYRSVQHSLTLDEVKERFKQHRRGAADWRHQNEWKEVEIPEGFGCAGMLFCLVLSVARVGTAGGEPVVAIDNGPVPHCGDVSSYTVYVSFPALLR